MTSPTHSNDLIDEKSPYLLQHAHNPVNWHAWGEKAFQLARQQDKPIFLSIGYSTCHWCHVMEEESFSNTSIAKVLNDYFISIKVDREERPDVDHIYMQAVQAMTQQGGWPLNVFLTPELKPFYGGTYFPPEDKWGRPGFSTLLLAIANKWSAERSQIVDSSNQLTRALAEAATQSFQGNALSQTTLEEAYQQFQKQFETHYGGFDHEPKFPRAHALSYVLRCWRRQGDESSLNMVTKTLDEMAKGGIYDHIGGGIHRYSTDMRWFLPHFEKMLYDQAIAVRTYVEAYQVTGKADYANHAKDILAYVLRDLHSPQGAFYSAEDADSFPPDGSPKKREGAFYVWMQKELKEALDENEFNLACFLFGIEAQGNVENDPHQEFTGQNVLSLTHSIPEAAAHLSLSEAHVKSIWASVRQKLMQQREKKPRPHLDDKVLTDWNGLMIASLAFAGRVLNHAEYIQAAQKAADFILNHMIREDGRLMHRFRDADVAIEALLDDYAFFVYGLTELYEATFETRYLSCAVELTEKMLILFWDQQNGGLFFRGNDQEPLIAPAKEIYDGALPSGNSIAALNLLRLGHLTSRSDFLKKSEALLQAFSRQVSHYPAAYPQFLIALDFAVGPSREVVVVGSRKDETVKQWLATINQSFYPNQVVIWRPDQEDQAKALLTLIPFIQKQKMVEGKATAYICENFACQLPTTNRETFEKQLQGVSNA